jgi:histidine ammonia-lyase
MTVVLTGSDLTLDEVVRVARSGERVELAPEALMRMQDVRAIVDRALQADEPVYGLNVGVGMRKKYRVPPDEIRAFNRALVLNHRTAQGPPAPEEVVRAMAVRLVNGFAKGTVGVRPLVAERIVEVLNERRPLAVRSLGSLGQADLPQTADLAYAIFGDLELEAKDGIGLLNSGAYSTGLGALAVADAARLADALDVGAALDLEAFAANLTILHPAVGETRPYPGLVASLARFRSLLDGSFLWQPGAARNLQDPLTFRNVVQVHGALRDALDFALRQLAVELNASQDNPLAVAEEGRFVSVANFDVLPLAAALDFLRIALAPALTSACERSLKLLQAHLTGLAPGLAVREGHPEDSISEFGVPAQSLAAEARLLAQPVSFEVVSTTHAEGIEDRMTMAPLAASRLAEMVALGERLLAIELVIAAQAIDLRGLRPLGSGTQHAYELVRERIPFCGEGEPIPPDLEPVVELVRSRALSRDSRSGV